MTTAAAYPAKGTLRAKAPQTPAAFSHQRNKAERALLLKGRPRLQGASDCFCHCRRTVQAFLLSGFYACHSVCAKRQRIPGDTRAARVYPHKAVLPMISTGCKDYNRQTRCPPDKKIHTLPCGFSALLRAAAAASGKCFCLEPTLKPYGCAGRNVLCASSHGFHADEHG